MNHIDLTPWTSALWLCEPDRLQRAVVRARTHGRCYTREEILAAHRESLEMAKGLADGAVEGTGETDLAELAYEQMRIESKLEAPRAIRATKGKIGVIEVFGPIDQRMSSELMKTGGTSTEFIGTALDSLLANPSVGAIVLRFDSPGGGVHGVEELSDRIFQARGEKKIYAHADSMAASAAFWLASAADMVLATSGSDLGSIGVYRLHEDHSANLEKEGVKVTMVSAGQFKTEFSPFAPLSDDARAEMQARVNETYGKFQSALSRNMGLPIDKVRKDFGDGRVVSAQDALKRGMIHRIMTFQQLMSKLTGSEQQVTAPMATNRVSAEVLLARHKLRQRKSPSRQT